MQTDPVQGRGMITKERALRFRFSTMPRIVLEAKGVSLNAKTLYCKLVDYLYEAEDIFCWPSQEKLAEDLDTSKWTVIRCLNELRDYGLIDWKQQGLSKTNVYWLLEFPDSLIEEYEARQEEKRQARLTAIQAEARPSESSPKDASTPPESQKKKVRQEKELRTHSGQGVGTVPIQELAGRQFRNLQEYQTNNKQTKNNHETTTTPAEEFTSSDTLDTPSVEAARKDVVVLDGTEPTAEEPQEDAEEAIRAMIEELIEIGVFESFAEGAVEEYGLARCHEVLNACKASSPKNPAGWIHDALVEEWNLNSAGRTGKPSEKPQEASKSDELGSDIGQNDSDPLCPSQEPPSKIVLEQTKSAFTKQANRDSEERERLAAASPHREFWEDIKKELSKRISRQSMASWFEPCYILAIEDDKLILSAPTEFVRDWIIENYQDLLNEIIGCDVEVVDEGSEESTIVRKEAQNGQA